MAYREDLNPGIGQLLNMSEPTERPQIFYDSRPSFRSGPDWRPKHTGMLGPERARAPVAEKGTRSAGTGMESLLRMLERYVVNPGVSAANQVATGADKAASRTLNYIEELLGPEMTSQVNDWVYPSRVTRRHDKSPVNTQ